MGGAFILMGQCFINPFFLLIFLKLLAKRENEMTYLGAFFTHFIGLVTLLIMFYGPTRDLGIATRSLLSTGAFFLVTLIIVKLVAKIGATRAIGVSVTFWLFNLGLNWLIWSVYLQPQVATAGG